MGHKVNHSARFNNCKFSLAQHPRFGFIRSVVAIKDIQAGEELLVDYEYVPPYPQWYKDAEVREVFQEYARAQFKSLRAQVLEPRA